MKKLLLISTLFLFLISLFSLSAQAVPTIDITGFSFDKTSYNPGETATGKIVLLNNPGTSALTVTSSSSDLMQGSETITKPSIGQVTIPIAPNNQVNQTFTIIVPSKLFGTYSGTLTAADVSNPTTNMDSYPYSLVINALTEVTFDGLSSNKLLISTQKDKSTTKSFTIRNSGSTTLNNIQVTRNGTFTDSDDDQIIFEASAVPTTLAPGASFTYSLEATPEDDMDVGTYTGTIKFSSTEVTEKTADLSVTVDPEVCSDGRVSNGNSIETNENGNLQITIDEPDSGDDFNPGDKIQISGEVDNTDNNDYDVVVEAILYNIDRDNEVARVETDSFTVNEDDSEDFDLELEVPLSDSDLKESDEYILFVKVYEDGSEDENCNYEDKDLDLKRESNQVAIEKVAITPSVASCNANVNFVVDVQNVGKENEDRVSIKLRETELKLDYETEYFDLKKFDKSGDSATKLYTFRIPSNTPEKDYFIESVVIFDGGKKSNSELTKLTVKGCNVALNDGNVKISLIQDKVTATQGKLFGFPFKVSNLVNNAQTYTVEITPSGNWAEKPQDQTVTLQGNQELTLYTYVTPKADITNGNYNLEIKVKQDNVVLKTQTASVQLGTNDGSGITGGTVFLPSVTIGSIWRNLANSVAFWIIAIIIIFALVIYVLAVLLRPRK